MQNRRSENSQNAKLKCENTRENRQESRRRNLNALKSLEEGGQINCGGQLSSTFLSGAWKSLTSLQ